MCIGDRCVEYEHYGRVIYVFCGTEQGSDGLFHLFELVKAVQFGAGDQGCV